MVTNRYYLLLVVPILLFGIFFLAKGGESATGVFKVSPLISLGLMISFVIVWVRSFRYRNKQTLGLDKGASRKAFVDLYYVNFNLFIVLAASFWLSTILFLLTYDAYIVILFTRAMGVCSFEIPNLTRYTKQLKCDKDTRKKVLRGEPLD
jgi:hypothetical protein